MFKFFGKSNSSRQIVQYRVCGIFFLQIHFSHCKLHHCAQCVLQYVFIRAALVINTTYARQQYNLILQLFQWMNIDEQSLLYGLDHITLIKNLLLFRSPAAEEKCFQGLLSLRKNRLPLIL